MTFDFTGVHVYCDNDATLVDSEIIAMPHAVASVFAYFDSIGVAGDILPADRKQYEVTWAGKQISQMFERIEEMTGYHLSDDVRNALCADDAHRVIDALRSVKVIDGIPETLAELQQAGAELAVVTSSSLLRVIPGLQNNDLLKYFVPRSGVGEPRVWSATETLEQDPRYGRAIPKSSQTPQIYEYALDATKPAPGKFVAIEDSGSGIGASVAAGIPVIGLTAASHIQDKIAHGNALIAKASEVLERPARESDIIVVHDAREIPEAIGRILNLPLVARDITARPTFGDR